MLHSQALQGGNCGVKENAGALTKYSFPEKTEKEMKKRHIAGTKMLLSSEEEKTSSSERGEIPPCREADPKNRFLTGKGNICVYQKDVNTRGRENDTRKGTWCTALARGAVMRGLSKEKKRGFCVGPQRAGTISLRGVNDY